MPLSQANIQVQWQLLELQQRHFPRLSAEPVDHHIFQFLLLIRLRHSLHAVVRLPFEAGGLIPTVTFLKPTRALFCHVGEDLGLRRAEGSVAAVCRGGGTWRYKKNAARQKQHRRK